MREQRIGYIDLSSGRIRKEPIPEKMRRMYLGGRGLDVYLLYNHLKFNIDPLSPDNVLTVSAGLLGGTLAPSSGRCHIGAKSPLTNLIGSSNMGGFFAPELRFAGFDHLVITGKAEKPVYLWVHDGEIEVRDAAHLWGKDTYETPSFIRRDLRDEDVKVICIGLAGEKLVRFASVMGGLKNAAGRTGMGCVMGSKNLKAVAARGTGGLRMADPDKALDFLKSFAALVDSHLLLKAFSTLGTPMYHDTSDQVGRVRNRNFQRNQVPGGESLYSDKLVKFSGGMTACFGCPVHCRHRYTVPEGPNKGKHSEGPEWSTLSALTAEVDCRRIETSLVANYLVNLYGIDSLELGSMVSWAMELYEKGLLDDRATDGLRLEWGNEQVVYDMIGRIARREGLGDVLAEGPVRASKTLGKETGYYNVHIKGLSCLHTDERPTPSHALGIAVSTRGADHLRNRPGVDAHLLPPDVRDRLFGFSVPEMTAYEGSGPLVRWHEIIYTVADALGTCKFQPLFMSPSTLGHQDYCNIIRYVTGLDLSVEELSQTGERIYTLERMFNIREGASRRDDILPERYFVEPTTAGPPGFIDKTIDRDRFQQLLDEYYDSHGWNREGIPGPDTLSTLGLDKEPTHTI